MAYIYVGPCPAIVHRSTEVLDSSATALTLLGMQEFSTYNLTITSVKNGGCSVSSIQVLTPTAGKVVANVPITFGGHNITFFPVPIPSASVSYCHPFLVYTCVSFVPHFLHFTVPDAPPTLINEVACSPTSLTVGWNPVQCILQNSLITKNVVRYGLPYGVKATTETSVNYFTATGLTSYMFEVAAVNSAGQRGPFSSPFIMDTKLGKFTCNS